jgi:hypothetical protein
MIVCSPDAPQCGAYSLSLAPVWHRSWPSRSPVLRIDLPFEMDVQNFCAPSIKRLAMKRKHLNLTASQKPEKVPKRIVWQRTQVACRSAPYRERPHRYWLAARLDWVVKITSDSAVSQERQSPLAALHIFRRDDRSANRHFQMLPIRSLSHSLAIDG